jgi:eukaryotic-like serine/threonine-protein kinase
MPTDPTRVQELLKHALTLADDASVQDYLNQVCGDNASLKAEIEQLLIAQRQPSIDLPSPASTLDRPLSMATGEHIPGAVTPVVVSSTKKQLPSDRVIAGRYTLLEIIGEGGMGAVYLAEQTEPVKRQVALKLIKSGMDSKGVLARFDAERQALALMDHPNIARIYDGGVTPSGQPFFVMELVKGVPLTEYCDTQRLSVQSRLELFVQVCQAVQHAHQKGIIHRDLKPGNVLVTEVDGRPTPKVIDFGVAKATEQKLTEMTFSDVGAIVGTPAYMSPEQADPTSMDIDTRTDVYALGVMLYELLAGSPPIDSRDFKRGAILEMLRMVREVEPPRPSTKLSTADALAKIAANRNIEPAKLTRLLRGELDWVVMKSLEKDRNRRYDSANGLAAELMRYLAGEAVLAHPPSRGYLFQKFVRRNRGQVIAGSLVITLLIVAVVGTSIGLVEANKQTTLALAAARKEKLAKDQEKLRADGEARAKQLAEKRRQEAEDLATFVLDVFRSPERGRDGRTITVAEMLDRAVKELGADRTMPPDRRAKLQAALGGTYWSLGLPLLAIPLLEQSRTYFENSEGIAPDTLNVYQFLGAAYSSLGCNKEAMDLRQKVYIHRKQLLGAGDEKTIWAMTHLSNSLSDLGRNQEARTLREQIVQISQDTHGELHPVTLSAMGNLANSYTLLRQHQQAITLLEQVLQKAQGILVQEHPTTLYAMQNLVSLYKVTGRPDLALQMLEKLIPLRSKADGAEHPHTLESKALAATLYFDSGRKEDALRLREEVLRDRRKVLGATHADTLSIMYLLAYQYNQLGRWSDEIRLQEELLSANQQVKGPKHPDVPFTFRLLSDAYFRNGQKQKAIDTGTQLLQLQLNLLGKDHADIAKTMNLLSTHMMSLAVDDAWNQNEPGLTRTAEAMLKLFADTQFVPALERTAKVGCLLEKTEASRAERVLQVAKRCLQLKPAKQMSYEKMTLGMSFYCLGDFATALETLTPGSVRGSVGATVAFFRAMSLHQIGKTEEAKTLFFEAAKEMKPLPKNPPNQWDYKTNIDEVIVWLAHRRAKSMLMESLPFPRIHSKSQSKQPINVALQNELGKGHE